MTPRLLPCKFCNKEFPDLESLQDHFEQDHDGTAFTGDMGENSLDIQADIPTTPLSLEYVYKGKCPSCRTGVETIILDIASVKKNISVVAWCPMCKKQIESKEVPKIKE